MTGKRGLRERVWVHVWGPLIASGIAGSCLAAWVLPSAAQVVSPNINISRGTDLRVQNSPTIATSGNNVVAVWFRKHNHLNLRTAISRNGGITWADSIIGLQGGESIRGPMSVCINGAGRAFCAVSGVDAKQLAVLIYAADLTLARPLWNRLANAVVFGEPGDRALDGVKILSDRRNGVLYLVYTRVKLFEGRIKFLRSTDSGATWSAPIDLSGSQCNTAQLALGPEGELYVVWEDYARSMIVGRKSTDLGLTFSTEFAMGTIRENFGLSLPGWGETISRTSIVPGLGCSVEPAFLGVAVDTGEGQYRSTIYGVWTESALGIANPHPERAVLESEPTVLESEPNEGFGNATPVQIGDDFGGSMLSGDLPPYLGDCDRFTFEGVAGTTIQISGSGVFCSPTGACREGSKNFNIFCGDDTTALTLVACGSVSDVAPSRSLVYTLPTTGRYYLDVGCSASQTVSYSLRLREYVANAGQAARDHRDVVLVRSTDGGATWSEKVRVNDDPPMYDNAIPAVTVDGAGRVHVAWYDRRDEPECGARVHTYWTSSDDGGMTFAPSRRVSEQPSEIGMNMDEYSVSTSDFMWQVGDHMALHAEGEKVWLLWTHIPGRDQGEIYGVTITDQPTGITVGLLEATANADRVLVRWLVGDETGVSGYGVHRAVDDGEYMPLGEVTASGAREYSWEDFGVEVGRGYQYRLEVRFADGRSSWEGPVEASIARPTGRLAWQGAVPNPFADTVELELWTPAPSQTQVAVYDVAGHKVATLVSFAEGQRLLLRWNGRDARGRVVAPGVYLVRAQMGDHAVVRQVVRMK